MPDKQRETKQHNDPFPFGLPNMQRHTITIDIGYLQIQCLIPEVQHCI